MVEGAAAAAPLPFSFHVPQQSRREKLRYFHPQTQGDEMITTTQVQDLKPPSPPPPPSQQQHPSPLFLHPHYGLTAPLLLGGPSSTCIVNPSCYSGAAAAASQFDHHPSSFFPSYHNNNNNDGGPGGVVSLSLSSYHHPPFNAFTVDASPAAGDAVVAPSEPFAGYVALLKRSRFLKPAQEMLEEVCGTARLGREVSGDEPPEMLPADHLAVEKLSESGGGVAHKMRAALISMLDEVFGRYKHYYQQILTLITSFDSISGLYGAAPYASLALRSLTKSFLCVKDAIANQLQFTDKSPGKDSCHKEKLLRFGLTNVGSQYKGLASTSIANVVQPPLWRPQRGLPEQAVAVLKAWLYEHFLHPYPTDADKHMLAKQTGLTRNQVSNWFINARVRLWKPLVVEVHSLEMQEANNTPVSNNNQNGSSQSSFPPTSSAPHSNKRSTRDIDTQKNQNASPPKHIRNNYAEISSHSMEQMNFSSDNYPIPSHRHDRIGGGAAQCSEGRGVSLTLALNQDNGICLSE